MTLQYNRRRRQPTGSTTPGVALSSARSSAASNRSPRWHFTTHSRPVNGRLFVGPWLSHRMERAGEPL